MNDRQEGPVPAELVCVRPGDGGAPVLVPRAEVFPGMAPHELLVVQEHRELSQRLDKLIADIDGEEFGDLPTQDRVLLYRQHAAMTELQFVLAARILRFSPAGTVGDGV